MLLTGTGIIIFSIVFSYNVFSGKAEAPVIFEAPEEDLSVLAKKGSVASLEDFQEGIQAMLGEQLKTLMPSDTLPRILNLTVLSVLTSIMILGGGQIATLGIKLVK